MELEELAREMQAVAEANKGLRAAQPDKVPSQSSPEAESGNKGPYLIDDSEFSSSWGRMFTFYEEPAAGMGEVARRITSFDVNCIDTIRLVFTKTEGYPRPLLYIYTEAMPQDAEGYKIYDRQTIINLLKKLAADSILARRDYQMYLDALDQGAGDAANGKRVLTPEEAG